MKWTLLFAILVLLSCAKKPSVPVIKDDLAAYISENSEFKLVTDSLIACAAGGGDVLVNDPEFPISILFYPKGDASEFQYFESDSAEISVEDFSAYALQELEDAPILNGYLRKFRRGPVSKNVWGIVTYLRNGEIHMSNPIRIKYSDKPTENNPQLLTIQQEQTLQPLFRWEDGQIDENAIYFQIVKDSENNLLSGTYTYEKSFQFYDLSNVVLNIRDVNPAPVLTKGERYAFVMMAVSLDNWVNLVFEEEFIAE